MNAEAQIKTIAQELKAAAEAIEAAASQSLRLVENARHGDARYAQAPVLDTLQPALCAILEACAFQDLIGQRLTRLSKTLAGQKSADPLLHGPQDRGQGLDQAAADQLFSAEATPP